MLFVKHTNLAAEAVQLNSCDATLCATNGPIYKEHEMVPLLYPFAKVGCSAKSASPWRGPYQIIKCLSDVRFLIEEVGTKKQQVVEYDRLKRYHGTPSVSTNAPERNVTAHEEPLGTSDVDDHEDYEYFLGHFPNAYPGF